MYRNILVPVDLASGPVAIHILKVARKLAGPDGRVTLLHVVDVPSAYLRLQMPVELLGDIAAEANAGAEALSQQAGGVDAVVVRDGRAAPVILEEAEKIDADAIILGSHRPDYRDYLIGSTAARVVRHAQCTVIVERSFPDI